MSDNKIAGYCPMGCGSTLFRGAGGYVTCSRSDCAEPDAASTILAIRETEHIVEIRRIDFTIEHPLRDRLMHDWLVDCDLHRRIADLDGPPVEPGRYRVRVGARLHWERMEARHG